MDTNGKLPSTETNKISVIHKVLEQNNISFEANANEDFTDHKVLVAYMSQTGNTKKVAEAIYEVLPEPKEIRKLQEVTSLDSYYLSFLGFPIQGSGPNKKTIEFLEKHTRGKTIALFITHAAPENAPEMPENIQKFKDSASEAKIVGVFDCQGQLSGTVKTIMRFAPSRQLREWAQKDNSKGQPDAMRLDRAKTFANEIINCTI